MVDKPVLNPGRNSDLSVTFIRIRYHIGIRHNFEKAG
jgi:hypothetical protein